MTITDAVTNLTTAARIYVEDAGFTPADAIARVCNNAVGNAESARTREGSWAYEATAEQLEIADFQGSVAADALDGNHRPSVGNVWNAILAGLVSPASEQYAVHALRS